MRTRHVAWLGATALAAVSMAPRTTAASDPPPNVVLIVSDDQAWTDYSFMGHPHIRTPHLDRLASEGLAFTRGYVPASLCCPSLATIITGLFPHQHGITSNDPPLPPGKQGAAAYRDPTLRAQRREVIGFIDDAPSLPRLMAERGYLSLQTGKWWLGHYSRGGFTHGMTHGDPDRGGRHGDEGLTIGRDGLQPILDFVREAVARSKPFFVWYAPFLPHQPHNPPERLLAKYRDRTPSLHVAKYWAMVEWFDETCGELVGFIDREGLGKNTLILYVTDNGWIQDADQARFAPRSKRSPYDGGLRTPILIRWPGKVAPRLAHVPVSSIDLAPTILAAAGLPRPGGLQGVNLLDSNEVAARTAVFGECFTHNAIDIRRPAANLEWRWVIEGDWKLIVPDERNQPAATTELYHLGADPFEATDLAAARPDRVAALRARLDGWWTGR